jgi:hypothetical protein
MGCTCSFRDSKTKATKTRERTVDRCGQVHTRSFGFDEHVRLPACDICELPVQPRNTVPDQYPGACRWAERNANLRSRVTEFQTGGTTHVRTPECLRGAGHLRPPRHVFRVPSPLIGNLRRVPRICLQGEGTPVDGRILEIRNPYLAILKDCRLNKSRSRENGEGSEDKPRGRHHWSKR